MSAPIMVQVDRLGELGDLLNKMIHEYDIKKFWELDRRFQELVALNKLEDDLNAPAAI